MWTVRSATLHLRAHERPGDPHAARSGAPLLGGAPEGYAGKLFYHISTDEVYGALELTRPEGVASPFTTTASSAEHHLAYGEEFFEETTRYAPHSPYSASKASSDHFVRAYHDTYGMPTLVTNCSNNYGPLPVSRRSSYPCSSTTSATAGRCPSTAAARTSATGSMSRTTPGRSTGSSTTAAWPRPTTSVASTREEHRPDPAARPHDGPPAGPPRGRGPGPDHLRRGPQGPRPAPYAIDSRKLQRELGWEPSLQFEEGIERTVRWYLDNQAWMDRVTSGAYRTYYEEMYGSR